MRQATSTQVVPKLRVEPATAKDDSYLVEAFDQTLSPYYEGNHLVHAQRVLNTHLSGGKDNRGLLSARQLLLVLWFGGERCGILNLVFKRQATCKISPLILFPPRPNVKGLGTFLIRAAENEARKAGARNLYCTVARGNRHALDFFLQHGFVVCGDAPEQYKTGETETLLRRTLDASPALDIEDMISVGRVRDAVAWREVRKLLSRSLPGQIDGVSDSWLESMHGNALNDDAAPLEEGRSAWVYAAQDRSGRYRAGAIVTYKKGGALKIMPIASSDIAAFRALIVDLPTLLNGSGRKAYLHLAPSAAEVIALQESAWRLEALLPGAYSAEVVTQQWGCSLGSDAPPQHIRIQQRYLALIKSGEKKLEIRVGYDHIKRIRPGDSIVFVAGPDQVAREIREVRRYASLSQMLKHEDIEQVLPGSTPDEALRRLREIYPPEKEKHGIVVLDLSLCLGRAEAVTRICGHRTSDRKSRTQGDNELAGLVRWWKLAVIEVEVTASLSYQGRLPSADAIEASIRQCVSDAVEGSFDEYPQYFKPLLRLQAQLLSDESRPAGDHSEVRFSFGLPTELFPVGAGGLQLLVNLLAGDMFPTEAVGCHWSDVHVHSVHLPDQMRQEATTAFRRNAHTIDDIRASFRLPEERPLIAYSIRPRVGLSFDETRQITLDVLKAGFNIAELDARNLALRSAPLEKWIDLGKEAAQVGSHVTAFSPNLSIPAPQLLDIVGKWTSEIAPTGPPVVKIDGGLDGLSSLQAVRTGLSGAQAPFITTYPILRNQMSTALGDSTWVDFLALSGTDIVYPGGRPTFPSERRPVWGTHVQGWARSARVYDALISRQWPMPTIAGGVHPGQLQAFYELVGPKVAYFLGGAVALHPEAQVQGAKLCVEVLEASIELAHEAMASADDHAEDLSGRLIRKVEQTRFKTALNYFSPANIFGGGVSSPPKTFYRRG